MKVGDYVRTNNGEIGIIINCPEELKKDYGNWLWIETTDEQRPIRNEDIKLTSSNIIDLIEVEDYVNGFKVLDIVENDIYISDYYAESYIGVVKVKNIKSIVTKEQFESMEYKVGD